MVDSTSTVRTSPLRKGFGLVMIGTLTCRHSTEGSRDARAHDALQHRKTTLVQLQSYCYYRYYNNDYDSDSDSDDAADKYHDDS